VVVDAAAFTCLHDNQFCAHHQTKLGRALVINLQSGFLSICSFRSRKTGNVG